MFLELFVLMAVGDDLVLDCCVGDASGEEDFGEDVIIRRRIYLHKMNIIIKKALIVGFLLY
jgi:hypothetical protein